MFRASGESISTQCSTSSIPVPSPEACEPNLPNNQFNLFVSANWVQLVWFLLMIAAAQSNNNCQCVSLPLCAHNAYRIGVNVYANILFVRHVMQFVVLHWFCTLNILILVVTGTDILCGEKYYVVFICLFIFNIWILWFASHSLKHSFFERSYYLNLI